MRHHYRSGFEWYDTDLDEGVALLHRLLAAARAHRRTRSAPFARARARRDRRRPRHAARARRARRPRRARSSPAAATTTAPDVLRELGQLLGVDLGRPVTVR